LLDQELNSVKSHTGLRNTMDYFKYEIKGTLFCFSGPVIHMSW